MAAGAISRSDELRARRGGGVNDGISGSYLLMHDVPYVGADRKVRRATLVSALTLAGDRTAKPDTHVALFTGDQPCHADGTEIAQIKHSTSKETIREGLVTKHSFSN